MTSVLRHDPRQPKPKRRKYGNKFTIIGNERFHSMGEAARWQHLKLLERVGRIYAVERQVPFVLRADGGEEVGKYVADFTYSDKSVHGWTVIEDFKGFDTPLSRWKRKHVKAQYGIEVRITGKAKRGRAA